MAMEGIATIRPTVRKHLLTRLGRLAAADPAIRAQAAVELTEMVERRKLTWGMLLVPATDNVMQDVPDEWPAPVLAMLAHPDLSANDRVTLEKLSRWRAPGEKGMATLREIGAKLEVE